MTVTVEPVEGRPYPLDNDNRTAGEQHNGLATLLNPFTTQRIRSLVGDLTGKTCLEVGAGGGSVAVWLAEQVGPAGTVVATDLKPARIPQHDRLEVVRHDLTCEDIPGGPYDLIHARLVLNHLPPRDEILRRLVGALAPGGVLVNEDWAADQVDQVVVAAPTPEAAALYTLYQRTVGAKVFAAAGTDRSWARRVHVAMLDEGLVNVSTVVHASYWQGGDTGGRMLAANIHQLRPRLIAAGMTSEQLDELLALLDDPRLVIHGFPLYSTAGWRPAA
ncbi:MAG TPA: class I SAM-dependent methyltransferase [Micromonosporaceae bacterium]